MTARTARQVRRDVDRRRRLATEAATRVTLHPLIAAVMAADRYRRDRPVILLPATPERTPS